eukprot:2371-Eustigmatos_ZCMA.PRE.1
MCRASVMKAVSEKVKAGGLYASSPMRFTYKCCAKFEEDLTDQGQRATKSLLSGRCPLPLKHCT